MQSTANTVDEYLASLPAERRELVETLRAAVRAGLDPAYQETMQYGMIGWSVPHAVFPAGYHCDPKQPLPFAALASQKNAVSLYLMGLYVGGGKHVGSGKAAGNEEDPHEELQWFRDAWAASGKKKPDMGKSCIRFKKRDDVPVDVISEAIRRMPAQRYIALYLQGLAK